MLEADLDICVLCDGTPLTTLKVKAEAEAGATYRLQLFCLLLPAGELFNLELVFERIDFNEINLVLCHPNYSHSGYKGDWFLL